MQFNDFYIRHTKKRRRRRPHHASRRLINSRKKHQTKSGVTLALITLSPFFFDADVFRRFLPGKVLLDVFRFDPIWSPLFYSYMTIWQTLLYVLTISARTQCGGRLVQLVKRLRRKPEFINYLPV